MIERPCPPVRAPPGAPTFSLSSRAVPPAIAFTAVVLALARRWQCCGGPLAAADAVVLVGALGLGVLGLLAALLAIAGWFSGPALSFTGVALAVLIWPWGP